MGGVCLVDAAHPSGRPMIARLFASLRGLIRRRRIEGEIAEELHDHLEREMEAHRSRGVSPEEARRLALRLASEPIRAVDASDLARAQHISCAVAVAQPF